MPEDKNDNGNIINNVGDLPQNFKSHKLVYNLIIAIGVFLALTGTLILFFKLPVWLGDLLLSLGVAIVSPAIISLLYRKYLLDDIKLEFESPAFEFKNEAEKIVCQVFEEVEDRSKEQRESFRSELAAICKPYRDEISKLGNINEAGILGIYQTRIDAFEVFKDFIKEEERELVIVGSSLLGLLQNADTSYYQIREPIRKKIEDRLYIRFLLTHPMVADLRARQENRSFQDIGKEIIKSLKLLTNEWNVKPENIKLYQGTPTCFGIRTGRAMLLNFYPYGKVAYESTCFIVRKGGYIYRQFSESHFGQWNSNIASELPGNIESLSDDLEGYEESIKNLFSLSHDSR